MTKLSPSAAAKTWRIGKSTIYKAMNEGQLSFEMDESKKRVIDKSEMVRFFGEPRKAETSAKLVTDDSERIADLKEAMARQEKTQGDYIQTLKDQIASQQKQLDTMTSAVDRVTSLLEHRQPDQQTTRTEPEVVQPIEQTHQIESQPAKRKKSLFGRILSAVVEN